MSETIQHQHHYDPPAPTVSVKVERNSRGRNYEVSVVNAATVADAIRLLREAESQLQDERPATVAPIGTKATNGVRPHDVDADPPF